MRFLLLALLLLPVCARAQVFIRLQPLLHGTGDGEIRLQWETNGYPGGTAHEVDFGIGALTDTVPAHDTLTINTQRFLHRATLTDLQPGATYRYRVRSGAATSPEYEFKTVPPPGAPLRLAWLADSQSGARFPDVLTALTSFEFDILGFAGDVVLLGNQVPDWVDHWYTPFTEISNLGQSKPIVAARGNHDGDGLVPHAYLWLPENEMWYARTVHRTRFVFLDSNRGLVEGAQTDWLEAELASDAAQDADFIVAVFHHLPYTNIWCDSAGYNGEVSVRTSWVPLFEQYDVDLAIMGHAHAYERYELNGVTYAVVGGAGGMLDTIAVPDPWPFIDIVHSVHHYTLMTIDQKRLSFTAYDLDSGAPIDSFTLISAIPVPALPPAVAVLAGALLAATLCALLRYPSRP